VVKNEEDAEAVAMSMEWEEEATGGRRENTIWMHLSLLSSSISACTVIYLVQITVCTLPVCLSEQ
jgi:hypothetical protein